MDLFVHIVLGFARLAAMAATGGGLYQVRDEPVSAFIVTGFGIVACGFAAVVASVVMVTVDLA